MTQTTVMTAALDPFVPTANDPWDMQRVQHLYARLGYGTHLATLREGLTLGPSELVDRLINDVLLMPPPEPPFWAFWTWTDYNANDPNNEMYFQHKNDLRVRWISEMMGEGLRSKMAMFWHNHFVTEDDVYDCNSYMWAYYDLIHRNVLGNFRDFVSRMGTNPAMLVYLNGNQNTAGQPNENYARELMELFTMGEGNGYTQDDIVEVARALTGWRVQMYECDPTVTFNPDLHDNGNKTIFGQTGNWGYDDVHELIFTLRANQTAYHICEKLYSYLVYEKVNPEVVTAMAQTFIDSNWSIAEVLRQLLKSGHFFDRRYINTRIKSPTEAMVAMFTRLGLVNEIDFNRSALDTVAYAGYELGQEVFNPVDVAGWPEYHSWLNENTLAFRWSFSSYLLFGFFAQNESARAKIAQLALDLGDGEIQNADLICRRLVSYLLNKDLDPDLQAVALQYFKGEIPENYFEDGTWNLYFPEVPYQVLNVMYYLTRLPEWQLT